MVRDHPITTSRPEFDTIIKMNTVGIVIGLTRALCNIR